MKISDSNSKELKCEVADSSLPAVTASLAMLTVTKNLPSPENERVLIRLPEVDSNECLNRRCSLRPRKRTSAEMEGDNKRKTILGEKKADAKDYYLNQNLKRKLSNLETIYEEKDDISESTMFMSVKRYKRMIQFNAKPTDSKIKKRKARVKRVFGTKKNFKERRASMQILLEKLNGIKAESPIKIENEVK
ncbi:uncharacterized protein LOC143178470 isoform X2 [Calliopsis andreniformis]|uniref:uncharacterized protein LOC143178470 isoform X2 n=1 Tax=Calliopsis andreniformis TaxID=337506 RepID=UPI003FCD9814